MHDNFMKKQSINNRGGILIGLVIAVSIAVLATFFIQKQLVQNSINNSTIQVVSTSLALRRVTIRSLMNDSISKNLTLNNLTNNPNLNACKTATCTVSGEQNLVVIDQAGQVTSNNNSNIGFSMLGIPCNTFDGANGNDQCPYRYKLTWTPDCPPTGVCIAPTIIVKGYAEFKANSSALTNRLNLNRFDFVTTF